MGDAVAAAARALIGARFRLHGRDVAGGLDCVGVVALALKGGGFEGAVPTGYALRGGDPSAIAALLDAALPRAGDVRAGDVLLFDAGAGQRHLGIATETGVVHADAGLRRVVERPGRFAWGLIGAWRLERRHGDGDAGVDRGGDRAGRADRRRGGGADRA